MGASEALSILILTCAPMVDQTAMRAIVEIESRGRPFVIGGPSGLESFATADAARNRLRRHIKAGTRVDVGLSQISTANFEWLGLTANTAFEPCANLRAGGTVLRHNLDIAEKRGLTGASAMIRAVSRYNTGSAMGGVANGYVRKFVTAFAKFAERE